MKHDKKSEMITQFEKTPIIEIVCAKVGVSRQTHYRWLKEDAEYAQAVKKSLAEGTSHISDIAEAQLINLIKKESLGAVIYWLRHRHPAYANRLEISAKIEYDDAMTEEENDGVQAALKLAEFNLKPHEEVDERTGDHPDDDRQPEDTKDGHAA